MQNKYTFSFNFKVGEAVGYDKHQHIIKINHNCLAPQLISCSRERFSFLAGIRYAERLQNPLQIVVIVTIQEPQVMEEDVKLKIKVFEKRLGNSRDFLYQQVS